MAASTTFNYLPFFFFFLLLLSSVQIEARVNKFFSKFINTDRDLVPNLPPAPVSAPPQISPSLPPTPAPAPFFDESQNAYGLYARDSDAEENTRTITDVEEEILAGDGQEEENHKSGYSTTNLQTESYESPRRYEEYQNNNYQNNNGFRNSEYENNNEYRKSEYQNNNYQNNNGFRNSEYESIVKLEAVTMPIITFVARVSDGMLLVASMESIGDANGNLDTYKQQAKQIMKRLDQRSPTKCSIESGAYTFHYLIQEGVCYLTLADRGFPKRLAFLYLEEVHGGFVEELERDSGNNWRDVVTTVARPYAFIKFDKFIQKKRKEYADPNSSQNMHRLNDDLADIHNIMRKNIQEVLNRGERVEHVSRISSNLADRSKDLKWGAKKLRMQAIYRQYGPIVAVALFVLLVIYIKFF